MSLITRLAQLIKADSHHLIDQVELPDVMLKQALREMEASLEQVRRDLQIIACERQKIRSSRHASTAMKCRSPNS